MKNKKGFTLVELLAVIVILALIMGIAVVSIGGVLNSARQSTFKDTALSIINGVRQQVTLANRLPSSDSAYYFFESRILEKGGDTSPLGGELKFVTGLSSGKVDVSSTSTKNEIAAIAIGSMGLYKLGSESSNTEAPACADSVRSYVKIEKLTDEANKYEYSICLTAGSGNKYISGKETELLDSNNVAVIKP